MSATALAVIGYGHMSKNTYCPLLHTLAGRIQLAAVVEPDEQKRADAASTYAFGAAYADVEGMLAAAKPDAALVLVPAQFHEQVIRPLLDAGVDVYTEKPDVHHVQPALELVELARAKGCVYQVGQNRLFMTAVQRAKEHFAETPVDWAHVEKSKSYRHTDAEYLFDDGLHVVSPLWWLTGGVDDVLSAVQIPDRLLSAHFRLTSGGAATLTMHVDAGYWVERFMLHGRERSANVITPDIAELYSEGRQAGETHVGRNPMLFATASLMGFQAAVSHFLDCVESRAEPRGSAASLLAVHELMNEVFAAAGIEAL